MPTGTPSACLGQAEWRNEPCAAQKSKSMPTQRPSAWHPAKSVPRTGSGMDVRAANTKAPRLAGGRDKGRVFVERVRYSGATTVATNSTSSAWMIDPQVKPSLGLIETV